MVKEAHNFYNLIVFGFLEKLSPSAEWDKCLARFDTCVQCDVIFNRAELFIQYMPMLIRLFHGSVSNIRTDRHPDTQSL